MSATYGSYMQTIAEKIKIDPVTLEDIDSTHPRYVITIRRSNGKPYVFSVSTLVELLNSGYSRDPFTREKITPRDEIRIRLYQKCLEIFPKHSLETLNKRDLFERWKASYNVSRLMLPEDVRKVRLEGTCFLDPEDLVGLFRSYCGREKLENRSLAEEELRAKPVKSWLIRYSSIKDSSYNKAFVISSKTGDGMYNHTAVVHARGEGIYFGCQFRRGDVKADSFISYSRWYPTILDCLNYLILAEHIIL